MTDGRGRPARAPGLAEWLRRVAPRSARGAVTIALVSDTHIRRLNRQYRRQDYPTDVLSFPANPESRVPTPELGDIVIARGVARRQAREHGHSKAVELRILALHGLLHLLGYDHERDDGEMRRVEERLRRKGGLRRGLIARARGSTGSSRAARGARARARGATASRRAKPAARRDAVRGSRAKPAARPEPVEGRAR